MLIFLFFLLFSLAFIGVLIDDCLNGKKRAEEYAEKLF